MVIRADINGVLTQLVDSVDDNMLGFCLTILADVRDLDVETHFSFGSAVWLLQWDRSSDRLILII